MSRYYSYLLSSLPVLNFGMTPPIDMDYYIEILQDFLPKIELDAIKKFALEDVIYLQMDVPVIRSFQSFDTALRNHLVRLRCIDLNVAPERYLQLREERIDQRIEQYVLEAYKDTDPVESERILDMARWNFLNEMATGHIFDFTALLIYTMKLRILEKWRTIAAADTDMIFNTALSSFNLKDLPISRS
jgi:hypothetical protein